MSLLSIGLALAVATTVAVFGIYFILATTNPVVMSDGWYFVDVWLIPWQEGTLTLADLWAKRHGNHAQPIAALLFLANARWLGLDMYAETLGAVAIAGAFCVLLYAFARRHSQSDALLNAWLLAAIVCVVFSINAKDKISWSLVGLFYVGHCFGLLFLWFVAQQRAALRPALLFLASLLLCVLIDTTGVLWCAASIATLIVAMARSDWPERRRLVSASVVVIAAIVVYLLGYLHFAPSPDGPTLPSIAHAVTSLGASIEEAWRIVLPFGVAYARDDRLASLIGAEAGQLGVFLLALLGIAVHLWMWSLTARARMGVGVFVACGLALFAYGTIAGVALQRVALNGWEYLLQPRYGVFYDFLVLAPMLAWVCRPRPTESSARGRAAAFIVLLVLPCAFAASWVPLGRREIPWIQAYNEDIVRDTWQLLLDPQQAPSPCNPFVSICGFPVEVRVRLAESLVRGDLNLASGVFRERHEIDYLPGAKPAPLRTD